MSIIRNTDKAFEEQNWEKIEEEENPLRLPEPQLIIQEDFILFTEKRIFLGESDNKQKTVSCSISYIDSQ